MTKVLILDGHPDGNRFCGALAQNIGFGAKEAGHDVHIHNLSQMEFNLNLQSGFRESQPLEDDLQRLQQDILWCEHMVIVYPTWWSNLPGKLKGLVDRVFLPGFGFQYRKDSPMWDKLLKGRKATVITTLDTPWIIDTLITRNPGLKSLACGTLKFCGIHPVCKIRIGGVRKMSDAKRNQWLRKAFAYGKRL